MEPKKHNSQDSELNPRQIEEPLKEEPRQKPVLELSSSEGIKKNESENNPLEVAGVRQQIEELHSTEKSITSDIEQTSPKSESGQQGRWQVPSKKGIAAMMFGNARRAFYILTRTDAGTSELYEILGPVAKDKEGQGYLNMGYWDENTPKTENPIIGANGEMFRMVARSANLTESDQLVVDAGCGYGTNIAQCLRENSIGKMIGLNLSTGQVEIGNHYLEVHGLNDRGQLVEASATKMPFESESVDKMLSVEAAFHFDSRDNFLAEAYRTLKPGGLLAMSDLIITPPKTLFEKAALPLTMRSLQIPKSNVYGYETYLEKIKNAGFSIVSARSIKDQVVPAFRKWFWSQKLKDMLNHNLVLGTASFGFVFYPWDYLHVVAKKE